MTRVPVPPDVSPLPARDQTSWWEARDIRHLLRLMWARPVVRLLAFIAMGYVAWRLLVWGSGVLAGVIVMVLSAYALAFLAQPVLVWLERRRVGRPIGVMLLLIVTLALLTFLVAAVSSQITGLINGIPQIAQNLENVLFRLLDRLDKIPGAQGLKESVDKYISEQTTNLTQNAGPILDRVLRSGPDVLNTLSNLIGWLGQVGFIVTLALYFMFDYARVGLSVLHLFPRAWQPTVYRLSEDVSESFGGYMRGQLLLMLAAAALAYLGLLVLKVPNALALGLLSGLVSLIPYVGIVLAAAVAMLQALPQGTVVVGLVAAVYFVINQLQGNVLGPLIMGRTVSLSPAAILVALLVGLSLGGALGAIIAVPIATLGKRWVQRYWLTSSAYRGRTLGGAPDTPTPQPDTRP
ncbi:putative PurR-regulated permease PerM [Deinococcus metalli]|uniref:AI-2E family transporter n=1 Tax=Deinococcus metalli TaxID=1141878 RepID=A0A7W8NPU9_9DEIO|nr:AI-2E family transporter [Deinococcus metalli]MBB5377211.1 putative PurR-regulated permease PerM [Deinococcus metalli]GHF48150.1 AI-2E family transporter [Deinococcus metalli]